VTRIPLARIRRELPIRTPIAVAAALALAAAVVAIGSSPVRAASTTSCPSADRHNLVSARPGASKELVPSGARRLLLCRYSGLWTGSGPRRPAFVLLAHAQLTARAQVTRFASALDALKRPSGVYSCPAASGEAIVLYFGYAGGPDDVVTVQTDGCWNATNGRITGNAETTAGLALVRSLEALTPLPGG
jgi:hypothetical protein